MGIHEILKAHWGYGEFRPLQEDIILSVLTGKDTLALLPTGGGKSICFQVPALEMGGICMVISPLVALMKDQVENLEKRGIAAAAIYSGLSHQEITLILNNCVNGGLRFLYVSPERLSTELFRNYLTQMDLRLLAVDEAHCISQWGFDFRPEYRRIKEIREYFPKVPVLALTATATVQVVEDIQEQLGFAKKNAFRKSFERLNLHYIVRTQENKREKLLQSVARLKGSGLIYVRNRKMTEEIATYLVENGINTSFYHAGLEAGLRKKRQEDWIQGKTRILACTNAFGMGIDKPDCRLVVHYEMPDCLEAYYQEAGRAGRNGEKAYCLLLYHPSDTEVALNRLDQSYPNEKTLRNVYDLLHKYFGNPIGYHLEAGHAFDLGVFSSWAGLHPILVSNALRLLGMLELLRLSDAVLAPSRVQFMVKGNALHEIASRNSRLGDPIRLLLRSYGGMFDSPVVIREKNLAMDLNCSESDLDEILSMLMDQGIIHYQKSSEKPTLSFTGERVDSAYLHINSEFIKVRKQREEEKLKAMIRYSENQQRCRSRELLGYFDEPDVMNCGVCDVCKENGLNYWSEQKLVQLIQDLKSIQWPGQPGIKQLSACLPEYREDHLASAFRILIDKGILRLNPHQHLFWKEIQGSE